MLDDQFNTEFINPKPKIKIPPRESNLGQAKRVHGAFYDGSKPQTAREALGRLRRPIIKETIPQRGKTSS